MYSFVPLHGVQVVGFVAASPWNPAAHSHARSAVAVPAVFVTALATHVRTGVQAVAPTVGM